MADHPALTPGRAAVVTGAASGIGLAVARRLGALGMHLVLADLAGERLDSAAETLGASVQGQVLAVPTDVRRPHELERLREAAYGAFGDVAFLMNNAGVEGPRGGGWAGLDSWRLVMETNFWGVAHGVDAFAAAMAAQASPSAIVVTGSKNGVINIPDAAAYAVSKSAANALTEQLAFHLSRTAPQVSVHLLLPGWTVTGMTPPEYLDHPAPWRAEQVADFMVEAMGRGDVYILCPDNQTPRELDEARIYWAADDLVKNRPALSAWRAGYGGELKGFIQRYLDWKARRAAKAP